MIVENNWIPKAASKISKMDIVAVTIFAWVFVRSDSMEDERLINHESIHVEQYKETLFVGFLVIYVLEFLIRFLFCWNWEKAYMNLAFEKEAYNNDMNLEYLANRKRYNWIKFFLGH
jgi:hypothetical protein